MGHHESTRSVLVPLPPVHWGGLQAFAANLSAGLREAGWRWTVVVPPEATEVQQRLCEAGVDVLSLPLARFRRKPMLTLKALASLPGNIRSLAKRPEAAEASIVQAVGAHHFHGAMLAAKLRKPLVWQIHSSILPRAARKTVAPIISRRADAIMTNGRAVAKAFWGKESLGTGHFVFYAPVDTNVYAPNPQARAAARHELGCSEDDVVVGTVGNRVWQKNHRFLVDAAVELAHLYPRLRFLVLGAPFEQYSKEYAETVERPAAKLNESRPDYIRFINPGNQVGYWLHALDIFALTSHAEGVPIALCEAMSAGKPVVSVNVGSIAEIVDEGRTGFLYRREDLRTLTNRVEKLFQNRCLRESAGVAGRKRIIEEFSLRRVVEAHARAYEGAIAAFRERH
ncbi:MAG: glycosyltransferase family 4 protein [Terriglobales bacterium]